MLKKNSKKKQKNQKHDLTESEPLNPKDQLSQRRQAKEAQKKLTIIVSISIALSIFIGLPAGFIFKPEIGIGIAIIIPLVLFCFNYPRLGIWLLLIYLPFAGTVTYGLGEGNPIFHVSKDLLFLPALLGFILECRRQRKPILIPKQILPTLCILLVFCLLTLVVANGSLQLVPSCESLQNLANPAEEIARGSCRRGEPFFQGVLGFKILLGYAPLIFCAYYFIEDKKKLLQLGRLLVILAIIACSLGLVQYWMLKTGRCVGTRELTGIDLYQANLEARCLIGGALLYSPEYGQIRLPGTFVSPWHWSWFLVANGTICFASAFSETSRFWRIIALVGMGLVEINAIVCGQRLAFGLVPGLIIVMLFLTGQIANLKKFLPIGIGLTIVLVLGLAFFSPDFIQERTDSFIARMNQTPPHLFIQQQLSYAIRTQGGIFGRGLGRATSSTRVFGAVSFVESFHSKLLYELGYMGFFAYMAFLTHLLYLTFRAYRSIRDPSLRSFAASFWVFIFIISYLPYWYPLDTDPVSVYYWFFAGIILKLPVIDRQEQAKLKALQPKEKTYKLKRRKLSAA